MKKAIFNRILLPLVGLLLVSSCSKTIADFSYQVEEDEAPATVNFENKSEKAEAYTWDFGDGNTSLEESPAHTYASSGNYTVKLMATKGTKVKVKEQNVFIAPPSDCLVEISTSYGNMTVKLYDDTPLHRDNFLKLVEEGYYEDLLFHRVIEGFMIQGGDPNSRDAGPKTRLGSGGPDYKIPAEFRDTLVHVKGALAAARNNNPQKASSGSQFYIVQGRAVSEKDLARNGKRYGQAQRQLYAERGGTPQLDGEYTVFGMVVEGLDVLDKIASTPTSSNDRPKEDIKMSMRIIR